MTIAVFNPETPLRSSFKAGTATDLAGFRASFNDATVISSCIGCNFEFEYGEDDDDSTIVSTDSHFDYSKNESSFFATSIAFEFGPNQADEAQQVQAQEKNEIEKNCFPQDEDEDSLVGTRKRVGNKLHATWSDQVLEKMEDGVDSIKVPLKDDAAGSQVDDDDSVVMLRGRVGNKRQASWSDQVLETMDDDVDSINVPLKDDNDENPAQHRQCRKGGRRPVRRTHS
jgi:hypothetical protein